MSPSYHHAYLNGSVIAAVHKLERYSVFSELTLQLDKDYIVDICLYPKRKINFSAGDIIKMTEMPVLAIEVLSPTQGTQEILDKFSVYFQAGIQSCWLIIPITQSVTVYSSMDNARTFTQGDIIDGALNIRIPIDELFE